MGEFMITSDNFQGLIVKPLLDYPHHHHHRHQQHVVFDDHQTQTMEYDDSALFNSQASFLPNFSSSHHPNNSFFPNQNQPPSEFIIIPQNFQPNNNNNNLSSVSRNQIIENDHNNNNSNNYCYSNESKKRKGVVNVEASDQSSSGMSVSANTSTRKNGSKGKRVKNSHEKVEEKLKDVVHVRARRGQATDSHSLAERVRRGKINERLKCLQDIVPGCYKTMGMAVMLDEIINYVQSLQNQVEFLSMKLTAASSFYDFNSETDAVEKLQRAKAMEAKEMERLMKEGYGCFHSTWPL